MFGKLKKTFKVGKLVMKLVDVTDALTDEQVEKTAEDVAAALKGDKVKITAENIKDFAYILERA